MQSMREGETSGLLHAAYSPPQAKPAFNSGYPSPPSSGRADREGLNESHGGREGPSQGQAQAQGQAHSQASGQRDEAAATTFVGEREDRYELESDWRDEEQRRDDDEDINHSEEEEEESDDDDDVTITTGTSETMRSGVNRSTTPETVLEEENLATHDQHLSRRPSKQYRGPIRDTPRNPFLEGGPADLGLRGPIAAGRSRRPNGPPPVTREHGKMTYVFRGQRVTYADPYASDSDDDGTGPSTRGCLLDRLQPRLLFPSAGKPFIGAQKAARKTDLNDTEEEKKQAGEHLGRPSLDVMAQRQQARNKQYSQYSSSARIDLMTRKIDGSAWSDDDDEDDEGEDYSDDEAEEEEEDEIQVSTSLCNDEGRMEASVSIPHRTTHEDDDYDEEMEEQDDNPFMDATVSQRSARNAAFVDRLYQAQVTSTSRKNIASGVTRSSHNDHRFNPYNRSHTQSHTRSYATLQ